MNYTLYCTPEILEKEVIAWAPTAAAAAATQL